MSAGFSTAFVSHCLARFEEGAIAAGRDVAKLRNAGNIHFAVSGDGKSARENVRRKLGFLFRNRLMAENDYDVILTKLEKWGKSNFYNDK